MLQFFSFLISLNSLMALTPQEVVQSSLTHYPQVIESLLEKEQALQEERGYRGAFDATIKTDVDARTQGYYDGDAYKTQIEKSFPALNSKLYGGFRNSYGQFPVYEGKLETLTGGETFAGISLSLLRNSLIDIKRYKVRKQEQVVVQREEELRQIKMDVQSLSLQSYWNWVVRGNELRVYREILDLALKRNGQIKKRIKAGDLARIYQSENDQYIRKRQAQVKKSEILFRQAELTLSLFYRDAQGEMRLPPAQELPKMNGEALTAAVKTQNLYQRAIRANPKLKILQAKEKQADLDIAIGRNELLPRVDVNFEWNQDQGTGPSDLMQDENRIMLKFEVPIEYNRGLGQKRAGEAKKKQMQTRTRLVSDQLRAKVEALIYKLNNSADVYRLTIDQVQLAKKLAKAELRKFSQGASDLILVNIREEALGESQIQNLQALLKYHFAETEIRGLAMEFVVAQ